MPPMRRRSVAPFDCVSWLRSACQTRCEKSTSQDKSHSTDSAHGEMHLRSYELKCDLSISVDLNLSNYELTRCVVSRSHGSRRHTWMLTACTCMTAVAFVSHRH